MDNCKLDAAAMRARGGPWQVGRRAARAQWAAVQMTCAAGIGLKCKASLGHRLQVRVAHTACAWRRSASSCAWQPAGSGSGLSWGRSYHCRCPCTMPPVTRRCCHCNGHRSAAAVAATSEPRPSSFEGCCRPSTSPANMKHRGSGPPSGGKPHGGGGSGKSHSQPHRKRKEFAAVPLAKFGGIGKST